jgi:hypothetical protein
MQVQLDSALLAAITGVLTFGVRILAAALGTLKELNIKIGIIIEQVKDHEQRLRVVESNKKRSIKHGGR